ncbi:hypothetical protein B0H19DRAFT_1075868 [Mycena capillaripes]|nr:hypothetical protein B0H19DRAFT_1075868 [Mycena capillaripes]
MTKPTYPVREFLLSLEFQEQGGMQADIPGQGAAWLEAHQIQNIFRVNGWAFEKAAHTRYPIIALVLHPIPDSHWLVSEGEKMSLMYLYSARILSVQLLRGFFADVWAGKKGLASAART